MVEPATVEASDSADHVTVAPVVEQFNGLHIYLPCVTSGGLVPAETAAALFCLKAAGVPSGWLRPVVWRQPPPQALPPLQVQLPAPAVCETQLPPAVADCVLPAAHLPQQRLCVAGLCAVVRRAVRTVERLLEPEAGHYHQRDTGLLGFRRGTLAPPADASRWTQYVERDVPNAVRCVLTAVRDASDGGAAELSVPPELMKLEHHMQQPLRVHNVWKQEQQAGGQLRRWHSGDHKTALQCVRHTYAEGHLMTISDLLLYPCLRLMTTTLQQHGLSLPDTAPGVLRWLDTVVERPGLLQIWRHLFSQQQPACTRQLRLTIPHLMPESLYKKDPARYQPNKRSYTVQSRVETSLALVEQSGFVSRLEPHPGSGRLALDWAALPAAASPAEGGLPATRLRRKHQQLENMAWLAARLARPGDTVVDMCSGGGHLGLLLAVLLPRCQVVLVENKEESLQRGQLRLETLQLTNVRLYQCNMEFFRGRFQVGVSLHACGVATDIVIQRCLAERAALLCCPCCYGAVHAFGEIEYPRSVCGGSTGASMVDWLVLGHAADQTHANLSAKSQQGRRCMALVDSDRAAFLQESGYRTLLTVAEPADCSHKNHLLAAVPPGWHGDDRVLADAPCS